MATRIACGCGKRLVFQDSHAGKRIRCPACRAVLTVPRPSVPADRWGLRAGPAPVTPPARLQAPLDLPNGDRPLHRSLWPWIALTGVVAAALVGWIVVRHQRVDNTLPRPEPGAVADGKPAGGTSRDTAPPPTAQPTAGSQETLLLSSVPRGGNGKAPAPRKPLPTMPETILPPTEVKEPEVGLVAAPSAPRSLAVKIVRVEGTPQVGGAITVHLGAENPGDPLRYQFRIKAPGGEWQPAPEGQVRLADLKYGPLAVEFRALDPAGRASPPLAQAWDVREFPARVVRTFKGHGSAVTALRYSRDGRLLLTGEEKAPTIRLWDVASGQELHRYSGGGGNQGMNDLAFLADGRHFISAGKDHTLRRWNIESEKEVGSYSWQGCHPYCLVFAAGGSFFLTGHGDYVVRLWSPDLSQEQRQFSGPRSYVQCVALSPDEDRILGGSASGIFVWDRESGELIGCDTSAPVTAAAFSPDGQHVLAGSPDGSVRLWEMEKLRQAAARADNPRKAAAVHLARLRAHYERLKKSDGRRSVPEPVPPEERIALSGYDTWKAIQQAEKDLARAPGVQAHAVLRRRFEGHKASIRRLAFSADGRRFLTADADGLIREWDAATGALRFEVRAGASTAVTFSADLRHALCGGPEGSVRLLHLPDPALAQKARGRANGVFLGKK